MRLDKYLADCGIGTRSEIKNYIKKGLVSVNGTSEKNASCHVSESDEIFYNGKKIAYSPFVYIMLNKPAGVVSATRDKLDKTVLDLLGDEYKNYDLFPMGRLDKDTVGLLILTNDGEMAHKALSPRHHVEKTYYVETKIPIKEETIGSFAEGVFIKKDTKTLPAKIEILSENSCHLTIEEGKFHQVKLMFNSVGNEVTFLKRIRFGNVTLDESLKMGEYRLLREDESVFG